MVLFDRLNKNTHVDNIRIKEELRSVIDRHAVLFGWAGCIVYPLWGLLDYLFAGELWSFFLLLRITEAVLIGAVWYAVRKYKLPVEILLYMVFFGITFQISYMCTVVPEDALQTYFLGFCTIFIAANLIVVWHPMHPVFVLVGALISYAVFFTIFSKLSLIETIKNGGLLFITISTTSTVVAWLHYSFSRREVVMRLELSDSHKKLSKAYREITDNVKYAKRIQDAVLSKNVEIDNVFNDYFVTLKAKGVVSGDFYWSSNYEFYRKTGKVVVAAVDCTGHGVSGAFMSFIGQTYLDQIVNTLNITSPEEILSNLNESVRRLLRQDHGQAQDGMDIALCVIDHRKREVEFAGAHNPLVYIQNGELIQIKGDRLSIGGRQLRKNKKFTKHTISLVDEPTSFYVFSDGYIDQLGGKLKQKFMIRRFRELLHNIAEKPMEEQKFELETIFEDWRNGGTQIDDMLVLGFKI